MNIILLSGGSGTRLWPLSNEVRSKQFLKIFKKEDGSKESMVQRVYRMIKDLYANSNIVIATSNSQVPQIQNALGTDIKMSIEPSRKDTFPSIALAASSLVKNGVSKDEFVIVSPVDSYVEMDFFKSFKELSDKSNDKNITLIGIKPTYPSTKYGYILPNGKFVEKPDENKAKDLIKDGALWNSGVYSFKIDYVLNKAKEYFGFDTYEELYNNYDDLEKISIDYAVAEKESSIQVIEYGGEWKDLGTWNTFTEAMSENVNGDVTLSDSKNTHVINELSIPLVAIGLNDTVVAATPDGILVSDKSKSQKIKDLIKYVRPMYEKRFWGEYKVLDYKTNPNRKNSLTKELIIKKDSHISYQLHKNRMEVWTVIAGDGIVIIDGEVKTIHYGDTVVIKENVKHGIIAKTDLHVIEVQVGSELTEEDIVRFDYEWEKL